MSERRLALLIASALLLAFAPAILVPYAFTDDWVHLASNLRGEALADSPYMSSLARGCPTSAFLTRWAFQAAGNLENLRFLRLAALFGIIWLAYLLFRALIRAGWASERSAALAVLICALPPFQACAAWSVMFTVFYSCALAGLACQLTLRAANRPRWPDTLGALALLVLAATIYQVTFMYFVVFAAIDLFRPEGSTDRFIVRLLWLLGMMIAGLALGFLAYRIGASLYGDRWLSPDRAGLVRDVPAKLAFFVHEPLRDALQLFDIWPGSVLPVIVGSTIGSGLLLYFRGSIGRRLLLLGLAIVMVPGIYLPNLVAAENWGSYRTQIGLTSLIMLYAFLALHGWARTLRAIDWVLPPAALAACILAAYHLIHYYAEPQMTEIRLLKARIAQIDLRNVTRMRIVRSNWTDALNGNRLDEFGTPSSAQGLAYVPMVYWFVHERLKALPTFPIVLAPRVPPPQLAAGEALVDMSLLGQYK